MSKNMNDSMLTERKILQMLSSNLIRWSGLAALVGGVLFISADVAEFLLFGDQPDSVAAASDNWIILDMLFLVAIVLILLGLVGLYVRQAEHAGILGLVAFLIAISGTAMIFGFVWGAAFILPELADAAPESVDPEFLDTDPSGALLVGVVLTFVLFALGWLLFGLTSLRARVLPRGAAVLLMIGAVLFVVIFMLDFPGATIVFSVALAWLGYALWSGSGAQATELQPAM
jgi:hypothetical protein